MICELAEGIYHVGIKDWDLRDFHGFITRRGSTYNSYLILDDKKILVDTVKNSFSDDLIRHIKELTNLEELDFIIINHVEMDHSSSLPKLMEFAKDAKIITSKRGEKALIKHYGKRWGIESVNTGDEISTGKRTLRFVEAPMLHWPDSMFTYIVEDEILMPNDAFGQHLALSKNFDDEVDENILMEEAAKYYANILMPFASIIVKKINYIKEMEIPIKMIAPSHGIIWRSNPNKIIDSYLEWSNGLAEKKAVIVYDTMWGSTQKIAYSISEGISSGGIEVQAFNIRKSDISDIAKEILSAKAVVIGSPTINRSMFPSISAFLTYIIGLKPKDKIWASFGSFGWGGGAVRDVNERLTKSGFEVIEPSLSIQYVPNDEEIEKCKEFGKLIAEKIKFSD